MSRLPALGARRMNDPRPAAAHPYPDARRGFGLGVAAYGLWGVLPIYFKQLAAIPSVSIVAHRIAWSIPFLLILLLVGRNVGAVTAALADRKTRNWLALTSLLIGINWLLYVY